MKRKLVSQGLGAYTITLPIEWIRNNNLSSSDSVDVFTFENNVVISNLNSFSSLPITVTLLSLDEVIIRTYLNNLYRLGFDVVYIKIVDPTQFTIISTVVESLLLGFEASLLEPNLVRIESITEPGSDKQKIIFRKMFFIVSEMFTLSSKDDVSLLIIQENMLKVGFYDNFCRRSISKKKYFTEKTHLYWSLSNYVKLLAHLLYHFSCENNNGSKKMMLKHLHDLRDLFILVREAFFMGDSKKVEVTTLKITSYFVDKDGLDHDSYHYARELIRILLYISSNMLGLLMDTRRKESAKFSLKKTI